MGESCIYIYTFILRASLGHVRLYTHEINSRENIYCGELFARPFSSNLKIK